MLSKNVNLKVFRQGWISMCHYGFHSFHTYASISHMLDTVLGREDMHRGTSLLYSRTLQESKRQTARS